MELTRGEEKRPSEAKGEVETDELDDRAKRRGVRKSPLQNPRRRFFFDPSGVINPGTEVTKVCGRRNKEFLTKEGVVTIRGPMYPRKECRECEDKELAKLVKKERN